MPVRTLALIAALAAGGAGCVSVPESEPAPFECRTDIQYETDDFGVPSVRVNGRLHELGDDERDRIGQRFVDFYCPRTDGG